MSSFTPTGPMTDEQLFSIIDERKQLPEHLFVSNFLPVFSGAISIDKVPDFMSVWVSITGSPGSGLDIIDNSGKVLFTVPPIFDSTFIDPNRKDGSMNFAEIIHFAKMHNGISPHLERSVFVSNIQKKLDAMQKNSPTFAKNINLWIDIFKRYKVGEFKIDNLKAENISNSVKVSNVTDDDFE